MDNTKHDEEDTLTEDKSKAVRILLRRTHCVTLHIGHLGFRDQTPIVGDKYIPESPADC